MQTRTIRNWRFLSVMKKFAVLFTLLLSSIVPLAVHRHDPRHGAYFPYKLQRRVHKMRCLNRPPISAFAPLAQSFSPLGIVKQVCLCSHSSKTLPACSPILTYLKYAPVCLAISALTLVPYWNISYLVAKQTQISTSSISVESRSISTLFFRNVLLNQSFIWFVA